jgi:hypothetical protein
VRDGLWTTAAPIAHRVGSYKNKGPRTPVGAHPVHDGSWTTTIRIAHRVGAQKDNGLFKPARKYPCP